MISIIKVLLKNKIFCKKLFLHNISTIYDITYQGYNLRRRIKSLKC